jgi:long-chain fatty acid transport protein
MTGNIGIRWNPASDWAIGASVMPPFNIHASGTLDTERGPLLNGAAQIDGNAVDVGLKFPTIARLGVRHWFRENLSVEVAGVYEGWSRFQSIRLVPDITVTAPFIGLDHKRVDPIDFTKNYRDVYSVRVGGEWFPKPWLAARLGGYYESAGSAKEWLDITSPESNKFGVTVGASVRVARYLWLDAAYAHTFFTTVTVSQTAQNARNIVAEDNTVAIGNGTYRMSMDFVHAGLRLQL